MTGLNITLRPTRIGETKLEVGVANETWRTVMVANGEPAYLYPGWRSEACVDLAGRAYLVLLTNGADLTAVWVVDQDFVVLRDVVETNISLSSELQGLLAQAAQSFAEDMRRNPFGPSGDQAFNVLRRIGPNSLWAFVSMAERPLKVRPAAALTELSVQQGVRRLNVIAGALQRVLSTSTSGGHASHRWIISAARTGMIKVPAISHDGYADSAYLIARLGAEPFYFCCEKGTGLAYYVIQRPACPSLIYLPDDDLLVCETEGDIDEATAREVLRLLDVALLALAQQIKRPPTKKAGVGVFTFGLAHLGHVVWDEMCGLDTYLAALPEGAPPSCLYTFNGGSGLELYGSFEELYPEFSGRVTVAASEAAMFAAAIEAGIELVMISGHRILQSARARTTRVVDAYAKAKGLPEQSAKSLGKQRRRLIITFGLRLSNRCPVDPVGFYVRLTRALVRRFGPLVIVIDGISGPDDLSKTAAPIFNGGHQEAEISVDGPHEPSAELRAEMDWVSRFTEKVKREKVQIVNCVGRPLKENLYWVSQSKFFVASYGAGMVKFRWVFDIPGFVLLSAINEQLFDARALFIGHESVEPPFSPLYFTETSDVTDVPEDPPRTDLPRRIFVPYPEDFVVNEERVIPRICDLVATHGGARFERRSERGLVGFPGLKALRAHLRS